MTRRWPIPVPLEPDELISSWLVRSALAQGCDPLVLTGSLWPGWRPWTVDIDRELPPERLPVLSDVSSIPEDTFKKAALCPEVERMVGHALQLRAVWPWLLALGARNRKRLGGLQYCPQCLATDRWPYFRKGWRYAWNTVCLDHGLRLSDRCPQCDAPLEPHRLVAEDRHLAICATCRFDFRETPKTVPKSGAISLARMAWIVLRESAGHYGGNRLAVSEWFSLVRFFIALVRRSGQSRWTMLRKALANLGIDVDGGNMPASGLAFELIAVRERETLLDGAMTLMATPSEQLTDALLRHSVSRVAFVGEEALPRALKPITDQLPATSRRKRKPSTGTPKPRSKEAVMKAWVRLQRKIRVSTP